MLRISFLGLSLLLFSLFSPTIFAHGSMEIPLSRIYNCYKEGPENVTSEACKAFVAMSGKQPLYDWDMVNQFNANDNHTAVVPDGTLCAGGRDKYAGLNMTRTDWFTTTIKPDASGKFNFVFRATVPHATKYFRFYFTKDNYDFSMPLKWSDLDTPFCTNTSPVLDNGRYNFLCTLPNKTGRRILYMVWQRSDSAEAFYSCSDVILSNETALKWQPISNFKSTSSVKVDTTITFWLMKDCVQVETYNIKVAAGQGAIDQWPFYLAQEINGKSNLVHIGQLNTTTDQVTPVQSATANNVYVKDTNISSYFYIVDFSPIGQFAKSPSFREKYCREKMLEQQLMNKFVGVRNS